MQAALSTNNWLPVKLYEKIESNHLRLTKFVFSPFTIPVRQQNKESPLIAITRAASADLLWCLYQLQSCYFKYSKHNVAWTTSYKNTNYVFFKAGNNRAKGHVDRETVIKFSFSRNLTNKFKLVPSKPISSNKNPSQRYFKIVQAEEK